MLGLPWAYYYMQLLAGTCRNAVGFFLFSACAMKPIYRRIDVNVGVDAGIRVDGHGAALDMAFAYALCCAWTYR